MTTMQLNAKKLEIISMLMDTDDEKKVDKMWKLARKEESFEPIPGFAYTHEERMATVEKGLADIEAGRTFTMEQVRAKFSRV